MKGVLLVVAQRLGRRPGHAIGAELSVDEFAGFVGQRDLAENAVTGGHGNRGVHRDTDRSVGHRRLQFGH